MYSNSFTDLISHYNEQCVMRYLHRNLTIHNSYYILTHSTYNAIQSPSVACDHSENISNIVSVKKLWSDVVSNNQTLQQFCVSEMSLTTTAILNK